MDDKLLKTEQYQEFEELVKPLIKYLNDSGNPHTSIIITPTSAELVMGIFAKETFEYVKD